MGSSLDTPIYPLTYESNKTEMGTRTTFGVILVGLLICSYFYVLPLGRYSFFGTASDFRIYDFVFIITALFVGLGNVSKIKELASDRSRFPYWTIVLILLVWAGLVLTTAISGLDKIFVTALRAYRFTAYFSTPLLILVIADTPGRQRFLFNLFYINILIQTWLAFGQGIGYLPDFWPEYWRPAAYIKVPSGTLSPHHLQIAVILMIGLVISATIMRTSRSILAWIIVGISSAAMISVIFMTGTRTVWFALPPMFLAYIFVHRVRGVATMIVVGLVIALTLYFLSDYVSDPIKYQLDSRLFDRVENYGVADVFSDRIQIYSGSFWDRVAGKPWVLIIGTGFQNISYFLGATGAHNNFLQAWFELGLVGLVIYLIFLGTILATLREAGRKAQEKFERFLAKDTWVVFVGILVTMLAGETLWAQYSMFTLSGQILALVGIAAASLNWTDSQLEEQPAADDEEEPADGEELLAEDDEEPPFRLH
jgi:O-antigen ligase